MLRLENQLKGGGGRCKFSKYEVSKKENEFVFTMEGFANKIRMVYQIENSDVIPSRL
jgi:hypothetical protein